MRARFLILSVGLSWSQLSPMALGDYCFEIALRNAHHVHTYYSPAPPRNGGGVEGQRKGCDCVAHRGRCCDRAQVGARSLQLSASGYLVSLCPYFILSSRMHHVKTHVLSCLQNFGKLRSR
ncbi:hypothetical protein LZ31DRAFT_67776 [Colletotrichum somersetense]|nr:hypothetical protein LZ31DRAFT_67776 [Colletotrichum somersetense]